MTVPKRRKAPPGARCPTCGLDVSGYTIGRTRDGHTTWDRPFHREVGPTGTPYGTGGLTHIEGGERCLRAVEIARTG